MSKKSPHAKLGALEIITGFPIKNKHNTDILFYKINTEGGFPIETETQISKLILVSISIGNPSNCLVKFWGNI